MIGSGDRPLLDAVPDPDDSGTDVFQRYHYQAEVAFASCLRCALVGDILSITPERIEDLLIEEADRWRFVQIKTRDAGFGAFTFASLLAANGGALRSILRTHTALADFDDGREIVYEIWLERGARRDDAIEQLLAPHRAGADAEVVERCAERLGIEVAVAEAMLDRTIVRAPLAPRELIRDSNIRNLQRYAPNVPVATTEDVYREVVAVIEAAMRAALLADDWPACVMQPESVEEELAARIAGKRLDENALGALLQPVSNGDRAVLEQITDPEQLAASELDRKLVAAGIGEETRDLAKQLRANATRAVYETSSGLAVPDAHLEDLDLRVLAVATASAGTVTETPPGPHVYRRLLDDLDEKRETVDPAALLGKDPMLLLGRLCDLSDRCRFGWRP
jgi:hypothetical protein